MHGYARSSLLNKKPTVKLDAVVELQDAMLLLMQLFAIKLLQLSLNVVPVVVVVVVVARV